jgi:hypothetical protein
VTDPRVHWVLNCPGISEPPFRGPPKTIDEIRLGEFRGAPGKVSVKADRDDKAKDFGDIILKSVSEPGNPQM